MSGTLNANYLQSDVGTTLNLNTGLSSGNVIVGNTSTLIANVVTSNTTTTGNLSVSNTTTTGNLSVSNTTTTGNLSVTGTPTFTNTISAPNTFGFKNRIINGNGIIYQRASAAALSTTASYVSCDRWFALQETAAASTFGISPTGLGVGFAQQMALNRNNGSSGTGRISAGQIIESYNLLDLQGKTVTFSFTARAGGNFSATSSSIQVQVYSGTTADQGLTSLQSGSWAGLTAIVDTTQVITTTNTTYSFTASVPSGCKELAVFLRFTPTGTANADDTLYFTNVQIESGSQATPFDYRPYGTELNLCYRYCLVDTNLSSPYRHFGTGYQASTFNANIDRQLPVPMRITPTVTASTQTGFIVDTNAGSATTAVVDSGYSSNVIVRLSVTTSGAITPASGVSLASDSSSSLRTITYNAEL
jgi:hypothetical protein